MDYIAAFPLDTQCDTIPSGLQGASIKMSQAYLINEGDKSRTAIQKSIMIGRTSDCDIVLEDNGVSRKHLEIMRVNGEFRWIDLGSTNGTFYNGKKKMTGKLDPSDTLQVGDTIFRFDVIQDTKTRAIDTSEMRKHAEAEEKKAAVPAAPPSPKRIEAKKDVHKEEAPASEHLLFQETFLDDSGHAKKMHGPAKKAALLQGIYTIAQEIAMNYEINDLMESVLTKTMTAIEAQRGAIFLLDEKGKLCSKPVSVRGKNDNGDNIHISSKVVQRVVESGESVLYQGVVENGESQDIFAPSESITLQQIHSIICVPLRAKRGIMGMLYIDTKKPNQKYTHDDLLLASAVGNSTGLAIENAEMHKQLLDKQRIEQEIHTAWNIQEGFLVKEWPENDPHIQVYGQTLPAKTVGGDFYDFVQPRHDVVGLLIGDVSGKGIPAALTMAQLLAQFRIYARDMDSPAHVLQHLNKDLAKRSNGGMFCTMSYLRLNLKTGEVIIANAGHPPALCISADGISDFGPASGPPLGILDKATWENASFTIKAGDSLLLYTDGITEARASKTRVAGDLSSPVEFDVVGLTKSLMDQYGNAPQAGIEAVCAAVNTFCAPGAPHDDCTMISLRYLGHDA